MATEKMTAKQILTLIGDSMNGKSLSVDEKTAIKDYCDLKISQLEKKSSKPKKLTDKQVALTDKVKALLEAKKVSMCIFDIRLEPDFVTETSQAILGALNRLIKADLVTVEKIKKVNYYCIVTDEADAE